MSNSDVALLGTVALILSVIAILLQVFNIGCGEPAPAFVLETGTGTGPAAELEDTGSCDDRRDDLAWCGQCFDCVQCWDGLGRCAAIGNTGEIEGCGLEVFCPNDRSLLQEGCSCVMCCDV